MSVHSVRPTNDDDLDQPRPSPRREPIWRAIVVTAWLAATGTVTAWLTMLSAGHPGAGDLRTACVTAGIIAIIVSCWYSIRQGQIELLAELRRTRPGYSEGYEAGHNDGLVTAYDKLRPWLPTEVAAAAEGNVVRMRRR